MALTDLVPWARSRATPAARFGEGGDPFLALHREMNRMFDEFSRGFGFPAPVSAGWSAAWPHVDIGETDKEVKVVAELPGMEEKNIEVSLHEGVLTLKGEKKSEKSENGGSLYSERWQGQFQRSLQLGPDVDPEKVSASFKNGVLTVTMAKRPEAESQVKRIPISNS
jgi:HSP20 family protein